MTKITTALLLVAVTLSGCKVCSWEINQDKRHQYFVECLKLANLPTGNNNEDDNSHIVDSCDSAAYYQAQERMCTDD